MLFLLFYVKTRGFPLHKSTGLIFMQLYQLLFHGSFISPSSSSSSLSFDFTQLASQMTHMYF